MTQSRTLCYYCYEARIVQWHTYIQPRHLGALYERGTTQGKDTGLIKKN